MKKVFLLVLSCTALTSCAGWELEMAATCPPYVGYIAARAIKLTAITEQDMKGALELKLDKCASFESMQEQRQWRQEHPDKVKMN